MNLFTLDEAIEYLKSLKAIQEKFDQGELGAVG